MSSRSSSPVLPLSFLGDSFSLLFILLFKPATFLQEDETNQLLLSHSLSELCSKLSKNVFPILTRLAQLSIATLLIILSTWLLSYWLLQLMVGHDDIGWAIRNLCFVSMIAIGLGSVLAICFNTGAGLFSILAGVITGLISLLITSIYPNLRLFSIRILSHTLDQHGLSYILGGFVIGSTLIYFIVWYKKIHLFLESENIPSLTSKLVKWGNLLFLLILLIAYASLFYYISQKFPGQQYSKLFIGLISVPAIAAILIRYAQKKEQMEWKALLLLISPLILFFSALYAIYVFLYKGYFPGQFPHAPSGTWIEGWGIGTLIGVIVGSYLILIHLLTDQIFRLSSSRSYTQGGTILGSTILTWFSCLLLGKFNNLDPFNKTYTVIGLIAGGLVAYFLQVLATKIRKS